MDHMDKDETIQKQSNDNEQVKEHEIEEEKNNKLEDELTQNITESQEKSVETKIEPEEDKPEKSLQDHIETKESLPELEDENEKLFIIKEELLETEIDLVDSTQVESTEEIKVDDSGETSQESLTTVVPTPTPRSPTPTPVMIPTAGNPDETSDSLTKEFSSDRIKEDSQGDDIQTKENLPDLEDETEKPSINKEIISEEESLEKEIDLVESTQVESTEEIKVDDSGETSQESLTTVVPTPTPRSPTPTPVIIPTAGNPDENSDSQPKESSSGTEQLLTTEDNIPLGPFQSKADLTLDESSTATVKFELLPSKHLFTTSVSIGHQVDKIAEDLASKVAVPADLLSLSYEGVALKKDETLKQLSIKDYTNLTIQVASLNVEEHPIKIPEDTEADKPSNAITVRIKQDGGAYKDVLVTIERVAVKKPFLGGYKHKLTGVQYHNASAQTNPKPLRWPTTTLYNRDTQTVLERKKETQTANETSTQVEVTGCHISVFEDKIIRAKPYFTSKQFFQRRRNAVIVLQKYWRRWIACRYCDRLRKARDERLEWERNEEIRKRKEKEARLKREFERRMLPKTKEDFDLVYAALEKWRLEELANINSEMLDEPTRKAALCALLEQETQLIASIGKHKNKANKINRTESIQRLLEKAAAPKRWKAFDGKITEMDTKYTIRAKEIRDIYNSITMKYLTQDERLDVLLTLKHTVKEQDCKLTREIIELIDREADLIMRGTSDNNLSGLRQRISTLFLEYCKNPMFNPEIARYLKVPQDPSTLKDDVYLCIGTNQYLPSSQFKIETNSRTHGKSRKAVDMDNIARTRQNLSPYRTMLRCLQQKEAEYQDSAGTCAFLLQEKDLRYLVETIWVTQSLLSAWDDIDDLELIRWNKYEEWKPWNCILLTKDEAIAHLRLENLTEAYGEVFVEKVRHKHNLARVYFSKLPGMSEQLRRKTSGSARMSTGPRELRGVNLLSSR